MIVFAPTWRDLCRLVGLEHGRVLTDDDVEFLLWECTGYPLAEPAVVHRQLHEALTGPPVHRCLCCGTPRANCINDYAPCCDDCYHLGDT